MSDTILVGKVLSNGLRRSKDKGTPSISIQCQAIMDISSEPNPDFKPITLFGDLYLTPGAVQNTLKTLKQTFGWKGYSFADFNQPILAGQVVKLVCEVDSYNNKLRIKFFNRMGNFTPLSHDELVTFCQEADKLLKDIQDSQEVPSF